MMDVKRKGLVFVLRITPEHITSLKQNEIFIFGSNSKGCHGKGAAKTAMKFGAIHGCPKGFQGKTYAIVTKDLSKGKRSVTLDSIQKQIDKLYLEILKRPELIFYVTPLGTALAGFKIIEIAPMFKQFINLKNVYLPKSFWEVLNG